MSYTHLWRTHMYVTHTSMSHTHLCHTHIYVTHTSMSYTHLSIVRLMSRICPVYRSLYVIYMSFLQVSYRHIYFSFVGIFMLYLRLLCRSTHLCHTHMYVIHTSMSHKHLCHIIHTCMSYTHLCHTRISSPVILTSLLCHIQVFFINLSMSYVSLFYRSLYVIYRSYKRLFPRSFTVIHASHL